MSARAVSCSGKNTGVAMDNKEDDLPSKRIVNVEYIENLMDQDSGACCGVDTSG